MCDECFHDKPSNGVKTELAAEILKEKRKDTTMSKRTDEATKAAILEDAAGGMNVEQIRRKHNVSWPTAKRIIDGNGAPAAKRGRPAKAAGHSSGPRSPRGASSGNGATAAMEELCEALWAAMPLEKKAALLKRMHEAN